MRLNELMVEARPHVPITVAHDPGEAEKKFLDANKGKAGKEYDVRSALKKVRDRYEVEIVGDIDDCHSKHGMKIGDNKDSLLTNRKKKS